MFVCLFVCSSVANASFLLLVCVSLTITVSHETASSSAECSQDKPPFSFVRVQDSTMWDIVWVSGWIGRHVWRFSPPACQWQPSFVGLAVQCTVVYCSSRCRNTWTMGVPYVCSAVKNSTSLKFTLVAGANSTHQKLQHTCSFWDEKLKYSCFFLHALLSPFYSVTSINVECRRTKLNLQILKCITVMYKNATKILLILIKQDIAIADRLCII